MNKREKVRTFGTSGKSSVGELHVSVQEQWADARREARPGSSRHRSGSSVIPSSHDYGGIGKIVPVKRTVGNRVLTVLQPVTSRLHGEVRDMKTENVSWGDGEKRL